MTPSEELRSMINHSGLTTAQFAKMLRDTVKDCKTTEGTLNRYLRGARQLDPLKLFAILRIINDHDDTITTRAACISPTLWASQ